LSSLSKTPSPSVSGQGQPAFSFGPATVGHLSSSYSIFISVWTPFNAAKPNTSGQASSLSATPSSVSGQPFNAKPNTSGQASALS
jgi:hypothetical protein